MGGFLGLLSAIKLALEVFKAIKGVPDGNNKDRIKAHVFDKLREVRLAAQEGNESGDYSSLEDILNRPSS